MRTYEESMQQQTGREEERMVKVDYTNLLPYGSKQSQTMEFYHQ